MANEKNYLDEVGEDFAHDKHKETSGVWMTYKRFQYRIGRAYRTNTAFAKLFEERMRPYQWAIERGNHAALKDVANNVLIDVYAETVLLGLRRVGSAEELPYTPEDGVKLLHKYPELWDEVYKFAGAESNFGVDSYEPGAIKDDSGN